MDKSEKNLREWESLYRSTGNRIWGDQPAGFLFEILPEIKKSIDEGSMILDAGAGEGRNLPVLIDLNGEIHAVDGSISALLKIPDTIRDKISIHESKLDALPFGDSSFDFILGVDIIETLPDADRVIGEFYRVLKSGGHFLCNIPTEDDTIYGIDMDRDKKGEEAFLYRNRYYYRFYNIDEAMQLLQNQGFDVKLRQTCTWTESEHPNFREGDHKHVSEVYLCRKP